MSPENVEVAVPNAAKTPPERINPEDSIAPAVVVETPTPRPPLIRTELVATIAPKYGEEEALKV